MAQSKAHEVDRYLKKPDARHRVFLVYGPDIGLVSERASTLAKATGADLSDPFATVHLDADDAAADPARLASEAHTASLFGGQRLIWLKGSTQKNLVKAIQPVLDLPPTESIVIIEAGDLKKSAPIRTRIEKSPHAMALPCYADQALALDQIISEELALANLQIDSQAKRLLASLLGGDRLASRGEVQKLCLYALDPNGTSKSISTEDIEAIVGDASALAVNTVVDAASVGDISTMEHMFKRLLAQGTSVVQILLAVQRHFLMLHSARTGMESSRESAPSALGRMRPPINFQRKAAITQALTIWSLPMLERALSRIDHVSLEARANATLGPALTSTALLALAIEAKRSRR